MKKFSKILAVILTVCLLGGMIAVLSSAAPAIIDPENQLLIPSDGSGADLVSGNYANNDYEAPGTGRDWAGAHGLSELTYAGVKAIATDKNGNKYYSIRRDNSVTVSNNGNNGYLEWKLSAWNNNASSYSKNNMVDHYDYNVFDLDFKTDAYSVWVGYKVVNYSKDGTVAIEKEYRTYDEVDALAVEKDIDIVYNKLLEDVQKNSSKLANVDTAAFTSEKISVESALATKTLALTPGGNFYVGLRLYPEATNANVKGIYSFLYTNFIDGKWYLTDSKKNVFAEIKYDEYIHMSFVTVLKPDSNGTSYGADIHVFVNGDYCCTTSGSGYKIVCVDSFRIQAPVNYKDKDIYSYCFDNLTSNYYAKGYSSGDVYGLDDYITSGDYKTKPIYELSDVVYNLDYKSPSGYIAVDGVKESFSVDKMYANLNNVKNGSDIETTLDIVDFDIPEGVDSFTVFTPYGTAFSVSEKYLNDYFCIFNGTDTYTVRKASENEKVTLNWVYIDPVTNEENILKTEKILSGSTPNQNDPLFVSEYFDFDDLALISQGYLNWKFDIDNDSGDVDLFEMEDVRALTYHEAQLIMSEMGGVLNVYCNEIGEISRKNFNFVIGNFDEDGNFTPNLDETGNYDNYANIKKLNVEIPRANDGDTVILKGSSSFELGASYFANIPAGISLNFDFNGSVIARSAAASDNEVDGFLRPGEGSIINIYSSKAGAQYAEAVLITPSTNGVFGTGGIISVDSSVDACEINLDGKNIIFTGGTLFKFSGGWSSTDSIVSNNNKKVLNINGGSFYSALRSSYGTFCVQCPDVVINLEDAEFFVNDETYSIIHDYQNDSSASKYYGSAHDLSAKNCDFVCAVDGETYAKLYYTMGNNSSAYFEDCNIIGNIAKTSGDLRGSVVLGGGNEISTASAFINHSKIKAADGVHITNMSNAPFNLDVSVGHANIPNRTNIVLSGEDGSYYYDITTGVFVVENGKYQFNLDKFTEENVVVSKFDSFGVNIISYADGEVPPGSLEITWLDSDGSVLATTYGYAGSNATPYPVEKITSKDTDSKWFNIGYSEWVNVSEGAAADSFVIIDGVNVFKPATPALVADVDALINMSYWSHYGVNLFVPTEEGISFSYNGKIQSTGFYNAQSGTMVPTNTTGTGRVYYNGENIDTSYVFIQPDINSFASTDIIVKFIVSEYDLNEDGVIADNEKNIALEDTFTLSDMEYSIKAAGMLSCGSDEMHLVTSYVRYKLSVHSEMNGGAISAEAAEYYDRFSLALDAHGENCSCYTDYSNVEALFTDAEKNLNKDGIEAITYSEDKGYGVLAFSYTFNLAKPAVSIYVVTDNPNYKYTITAKYLSSTKDKSVTLSTKNKDDEDVTLDGIGCKRYIYHTIPAENINDVFEFKVVVKQGSKTIASETVQYCLAEYIKNNPDYDMAKIYYDYSYQCKNYYNKIQGLAGEDFNEKQYGVVISAD